MEDKNKISSTFPKTASSDLYAPPPPPNSVFRTAGLFAQLNN